jgi:hypothetical protein
MSILRGTVRWASSLLAFVTRHSVAPRDAQTHAASLDTARWSLSGWKEELTGPSTNVQTDDYPGVKTFLQGGHTRLTPAEWHTSQDVFVRYWRVYGNTAMVNKYAAREWDDFEAVNA